jgi:hypothetical protein
MSGFLASNPCDQVDIAWVLFALGIGFVAGAVAAILSICALSARSPRRPYHLRRP